MPRNPHLKEFGEILPIESVKKIRHNIAFSLDSTNIVFGEWRTFATNDKKGHLMALTLTEIETAINKVLLYGQYVATNGYRYQRADLEVLRKMRADSVIESSAGQTSSIFDRGLTGVKRRE